MESNFSPRAIEAIILKLSGWSCQHIADQFGVTRQRASQMVHQALNRFTKEPEAIGLIPEELRDRIEAIVEERRVRGKRKQLSLRRARRKSGNSGQLAARRMRSRTKGA